MRQLLINGVGLGITLAASLAATTESYATALTIGTYYEETSVRESASVPTAGQCTTNFCYLLFNAVPSGKQLVVTDLSCRISVDDAVGAKMVDFGLGTWAGSAKVDRMHFFRPVSHLLNGGSRYFTVSERTTKLYRAGERPVLQMISDELSAGHTWNPFCTISGRIGNPPPP
jgi:hypothetical protein